MWQAANLRNSSLKNLEGAAYGATISTPAQYQTPGDDGDADPSHWTETLSPAQLPSAEGGTGHQPGWLHWIIDHLEGLLWPDADTGKMRTIGQASITAGTTIDAYQYAVDSAKAELGTEEVPRRQDDHGPRSRWRHLERRSVA